ncbi:hypothetical protein [Myceligenerans crystallogenes]|uniref:Sigma-70, region 4 n=1 Tax=Myceligenerans crystallogenes TaxID=316335 RepID=A0ABN2N6P6_9MICO
MPKETQGPPLPAQTGPSLTERLAGVLSELSDDEYYVLRGRALARRPSSYTTLADELGISHDDVVETEKRATKRIAGASRGPDHDALVDAMRQENSTVALATLLPQHPVLTETVPRTNLPVWAFLVQTLRLDGASRDTQAKEAAAGRPAAAKAPAKGTRLPARRPAPSFRVSKSNVRPAWTAWFPWLITLDLAGHGVKTSSWDFEPQARGRLRHQVNALTSLIIDQLPAAPVSVIFPAIAPTDTMSDLEIPDSHAERFREKGIETFGDLTGRTIAELRFLPHYGSKTLNTLVQRLVYRSLRHPAPAGGPTPPAPADLERPLNVRLDSTLGYLDERARTILVARRFAEPREDLAKLAERFEISNMHAQQIDSRSATLVRNTLMTPSLQARIDECLPSPGGTMAIDELVTKIPVLGEPVTGAADQPAWRVLEGLGGFFEVADGEARRASSVRKRSANPPVPGSKPEE